MNDAVKKLLETHDHVVLRTSPEIGATPGLQVEVDSLAVPKTELNGEVFRAGALHTVKVVASGRAELVTRVTNRTTFTVVLGPSSSGAGSEPAGPAPADPAPVTRDGGWGWQKWTGVGMAGAGVVSTAMGIVLVVKYRSDGADLQKEADAACADGKCPGASNPTAQRFRDRASELDSDAVRNNLITFGLGGALLVGGAVLFFTAPSTSLTAPSSGARVRVLPHVGSRDTGLAVVGTF
ncbi:hypothetical protein BH11MYX4_BH11MYX4_52190 [soil metagenome]